MISTLRMGPFAQNLLFLKITDYFVEASAARGEREKYLAFLVRVWRDLKRDAASDDGAAPLWRQLR